MPQFYLELDPKIADTYFESSEFSRASDQLLTIEKTLGIKNHFELFSYAAQNSLCPPEHQEPVIPWHEPQVGLDWINAVSKHIGCNPTAVPNAERLLSDFAECKDVLLRAKSEGSKWHFAMDI